MRVCFKFTKQCLENAFQILTNLIVPEPDHSISSLFECSRSKRIAIPVVLPSVDLDDQAPIDAAEIDDVLADRPLALELQPAEPPVAQFKPHGSLGIGHAVSQWPGVGTDRAHASA